MAERAADGDPEALTALLGRVADPLRRIAWHLCRDHHESEDLCQEALIKAASPPVLAAYRGEGPLDGYLIRSATRSMISLMRTRAYRDRDHVGREDEIEVRLGAGSSLPAEPPMAFELREAMAALPERARVIVLLLAIGDLTYQETAEAVGVPVGTVRSTYARAREKLQLELATREFASQRGET